MQYVTLTMVFTNQTNDLQGGFDSVGNARVISLDNTGIK